MIEIILIKKRETLNKGVVYRIKNVFFDKVARIFPKKMAVIFSITAKGK